MEVFHPLPSPAAERRVESVRQSQALAADRERISRQLRHHPVLKRIGSDDLIPAIETVGRGEALLDPSVTRRVLGLVRQAARKDEAAAYACLRWQAGCLH